MAQTTLLAAGKAAADSDPVTVGEGEVVKIGTFVDGEEFPREAQLWLCEGTPGDPNLIARYDVNTRTLAVAAPGDYFVRRPDVSAAIGVFAE